MTTDFYDMFGTLPRQTPGSDATTRAALALVRPHLPAGPLRIADFACGTGRASLVLAEELGQPVTALDIRRNYLRRLAEAAAKRGLSDRIHPLCADLANLPFGPDELDLIWCEGAAFVLGVERSCREWQPLLRPGGWLAFSDMVWGATPAPEAEATMAELGVALPTRDRLLAAVRAAGLQPSQVLTLPEDDWWHEYYVPLAELLEKQPSSPQVAAVWREIQMRWEHPASTDYVFVLAQRAA